MDLDITRWKWLAAWTPRRTVLAGALLGFAVGAVALLPLGFWLGTAAVAAVVVGPLVGGLGGYLVWRRSLAYVDDHAEPVLDEIYGRRAEDADEAWLTPLAGTGSAPGLDLARTYEFTRIERTPAELRMSDVTVNVPTLETTVRSTAVPTGKVHAVTVEDDTLVVDARTGIWRFEDVTPVHG